MTASATVSRRWKALDSFHQHVASQIERQLQEEFGVTPREYDALVALAGGAGAAGHQVRAVAGAIGLSPSATSRLLSRLHRRDLIDIHTRDLDRRALDIRLTSEAQELLRRGPAVLERITAAAIGSLDAAEHDPVLLRWLAG
ncbi:MarR family winged helix-turn-helix transcriptional regulator [Streptomyces sp. NPDC000888]